MNGFATVSNCEKRMSRFINPFTDYGFKKIFGQEVTKELLIDFLNALLEGERVITDLTFLNSEQMPFYPEERVVIYDIYCTTDTDEQIIVEMQNRSQVHFKERALFYLSNAITRQGEKGKEWQFGIKAVYGVFLMNFLLATENQKLRTDVILADRDTGEQFSDKLRPIFITLPQFTKTEEECETNFERWIFILKNMETLKRMPFKAQKAVFEKLEDIVDVQALSPDDRVRYNNSLNTYRTSLSVMEAAIQEGRAEGLEIGREEGLAEGIEKGIEKGVEKGREEERIKMARSMKQIGIPAQMIHKTTGLSMEVIEKL